MPALAGDSARAIAGHDSASGEVLVVVERGYVAHRVTETVELDFETDDHDSLRVRDGGWGSHGDRTTQASARAVPTGRPLLTPPTLLAVRRHHTDDDVDDYHMTIAFPALRRSARPFGATLRAGVEGDTAGVRGIVAQVDDASAADERRERGAIIARAAARAAAKYAVVKAVRDKKGEVAGTLANLGASLLERADVRSWHLLPGEIALVRLRLPAGRQRVVLRIGEGALARSVEVGTVLVRPGSVQVAPVRLWQAPPPVPVAPPDSLQPRP